MWNRAVLAMLIGCGLCRAEIVTIRIDDLPLREDPRILVNLVGKGGHVRTVPVPAWVKVTVDAWLKSANLASGTLFRSVARTVGFGAADLPRRSSIRSREKQPQIAALALLLLTTSAGLALACVIWRAGSSKRYSSRLGTCPSNRLSVISAGSSGRKMRSTTASDWSRSRPDRCCS